MKGGRQSAQPWLCHLRYLQGTAAGQASAAPNGLLAGARGEAPAAGPAVPRPASTRRRGELHRHSHFAPPPAEKNSACPPISSWSEFPSGCVGWGGHTSLKSVSSGCWSLSHRHVSPCQGAAGAPRHAAPGLRDGCGGRRGLLRRGVGTGAVSRGAAESRLPKETGCACGFLQRAEIPRGCSVVLRRVVGR